LKSILLLTFLGTFATALGETVVPIELQNGNPVVTAVIGEQHVRLVVDTGGLSLGLRPETAARLKLKGSSEQTQSTNVYGEAHDSATLNVTSLEIGGTRFTDLDAYEWQMPEQLAYWKPALDGTLGRNFLNKFIAVYDYGKSIIALFDESERWEDGCRGVTIPLVDHPERIIVTAVEVDHGTVNAIWDTGATHSFIKDGVADERKFLLETNDDQTRRYRTDRFSLSGNDFGPMDFIALPISEPVDIDVYIGRNFFANHVVRINPIQGFIRIQTAQ
tara:strand:- start:41 stop:865 length:825 start_codon:yes stop_codon:yes gene_type:complete